MPDHLETRLLIAALMLAGAPGCGGDDGLIGAAFRGIYRVTTVTANSASCETEGRSAAPDEGNDHLVVYSATDDAGERMTVSSCTTPLDCRDSYRLDRKGAFHHDFRVDRGDHLEGSRVNAGVPLDSRCFGAKVELAIARARGGQTIQVEVRTFPGDHAAKGGHCSIDDAVEAAAARECGELRVVRGARIEGL